VPYEKQECAREGMGCTQNNNKLNNCVAHSVARFFRKNILGGNTPLRLLAERMIDSTELSSLEHSIPYHVHMLCELIQLSLWNQSSPPQDSKMSFTLSTSASSDMLTPAMAAPSETEIGWLVGVVPGQNYGCESYSGKEAA
jgi:hypothetical protein